MLVAMCGTTAALAESRQQQAARAVQQYDAPSRACALLTKDEVAKITGRRAYTEPSGTQLVNDGSACDFDSVNVTLFSGPKSDENYDKLVKNFKKDNTSRQAVAGLGDSAYLWFPKPRDQYEGHYAVLVVHQGAHMMALALEAQGSEAAPSLQPKLVVMARTALPRLK
jgi:hypothetical protein